MSARTRAERIRRCQRVATIAGSVAAVGGALLVVGLLARFGWVPPAYLAFLAPTGMLLLLGLLVRALATELAGRHAEPADDDVDW